MIGKTISHYKILSKLGEGGMGVVYKAEDMKLDRFVALKFLPSHLVDDEKALDRLLKEAKAASKINHPNVCTIYAIEDYEDTHFIVMEFVDGQTLKNKIKKEKLSVDEAVEYSIQISKALKAAHDKDIIHRDIKSENIMINIDNVIKVMDFGLAKLKDEAGLTKTKTAGTIAYMSPEQIKGEDIDHRVDIWAFGVVLFEMLTGEFPFEGQYESAMSYSIVNTNPKSITDIRNDVPLDIEQVIYKALEKEKNRRYQNVNELIEELKKTPSKVTISEKQEKSIVVLPFEDISPGKDNEYFSDGLTEEIITDLSQIHTMRVISRTSAMMLKGTKKDMKTIGRELNVQYVLEGSVRKAGNNLRITAQLIDATTDAHLWAEKYSGTLDDVFDIQENVSRAIVDALKLRLSADENSRLGFRSIKDIQAYECYLKARSDIWLLSEDSLVRALDLTNRGLEIVGDNDLLYAEKAFIYVQYVNLLIKPPDTYAELLEKAHQFAAKALSCNPNSATAHFSQGTVSHQSGNPREAIRHFKKAVDLDPNHADAHIMLGYQLSAVGKDLERVQRLFKKALGIDPLNPTVQGVMGYFHLFNGNFHTAIENFRNWQKVLEEYKSPFLIFMAWPHSLAGNYEEAFRILDLILLNLPEQHIIADIVSFLKHAWLREKQQTIDAVTEQWEKSALWDDGYSLLMAEGYALIGEIDRAINWLKHSVPYGISNLQFLEDHNPHLESIRGEERFKKLMERVKYEWENFEV